MRYIRVSPVNSFFYDFVETPNGQYTAIKFWHDLSSLNGATHNGIKIFVSYDTNCDVTSEPGIFVAAITEADSLELGVSALVGNEG